MKPKPRMLKWMQSSVDKALTKLESAHLKLLGGPLWMLETAAVVPAEKITLCSKQKLSSIYNALRESNRKAAQWSGNLFSGKVAKDVFGPSRKTITTKNNVLSNKHNGASHTAHV